MTHPVRALAVSVCSTALLTICFLSAASAQNYSVTNIGTLGGTWSQGNGINSSGQVTGAANITGDLFYHAFLYSRGMMTDLGTLGGPQSQGNGINSSGQVVGTAQTSTYADHAFLYTAGLGMVDLNTLIPSSSGWTLTSATGINDSGQITGRGTNSTGAVHGFLYREGMITDLGTLGGNFSEGLGINAYGQITGDSYRTGNSVVHAFRWSEATGIVDLGSLGGSAGNSVGMGINASGHVGGSSTSSATTPDFAFLYRAGKMTNLGTLGGVASFGYAINDSDQVTGFTYLPGNLYAPAFLYTPGEGMVDVNTLIPSNSGWTLDYGFAINDAGQITGRGENHTLGQQDAFLLTPISIDFLIHLVCIDSLRPATRVILFDTLEEAKGARHTLDRCRDLSTFEQEVDSLHDFSEASQLITEAKLVKSAQGCD